MPVIRTTGVDDHTIAWGDGQEGVGQYLRSIAHMGAPALGNATFSTHALQLEDRAFSIIAPAGGNCWLTSLATTYGRAARDEASREVGRTQATLYKTLSHTAEALLRMGRADAVVFANHLLFSTSLYGDWTGKDLDKALGALRTSFPDRAIVWRSLNLEDNAELVQRMEQSGGRRLLSRIVWLLKDVDRNWSRRRDVRDDRRLMETHGLTLETARDISDDDLKRVLALYNDLYRNKYSTTNPAYSAGILRAAIASGVLSMRLVRNSAGVIEAFTTDHVYQGALINPLLGYDRTLPQSRGLYRIAMLASGEKALADRLVVNFSAGAAAFKRNRGARPALEFCMVFDDHLPRWRRLAYQGLSSTLEAMRPMLERIALQ